MGNRDIEPVPKRHCGSETSDAEAGGGGEGCRGWKGEDCVCGDRDVLLEAAGAAVAVVYAFLLLEFPRFRLYNKRRAY